ncbi:hypothetical protein GGP84_003100 [Salinibacter ruber]|nr:hypothetical protein [Salinibacter ruber]
MRGAHDLSPSKSNRRRLPWAIRAGNRSGSACCSPHRRAKRRAAQRQRVRPGRRDVSRRRVLPGATGQLVDTQVGTALPVTGPTASKRFRQAPTTCASSWGVWRHHSPPSRSGPEPNRPAQLPAKAPSSRRRSGLQALEDVPVVLSGGQRMRPGWRARPQVARARRGSRPLRLLSALRGPPRKVAPERQPLSDFASGRPTSNSSLCQLLSAKAPVFSPSRGRPHRCRCHGCRCPYCC